MSSAREKILASIRSGLGRGPLSQPSRHALDARLQGASEADEQIRPRLPAMQPAPLFRERLEAAAGTMQTLHGEAYIPGAVATYYASRQITGPIAVAPSIQDLDWPATGLEARFGRSHGGELLCVSRAFCAIAETGTLVLLSGPENPTTLNFLPDHHLVVLHASEVVSHIEDAWVRVRNRDEAWPRTVNLITGPSRTADVEQTIQLGAHGPRSLHVLLIR